VLRAPTTATGSGKSGVPEHIVHLILGDMVSKGLVLAGAVLGVIRDVYDAG